MSEIVGWGEPWAGTFACGLMVASGAAPRIVPYWGNKYEYRRSILGLAGVSPGQGARLRLSDLGPWAPAWKVLRRPERALKAAAVVRRWGPRLDEFWRSLVRPPFRDPVERTAQFLCLQACAAHDCAVWWQDSQGWRMGDPAMVGRSKPIKQRTRTVLGLVRSETLARRLEKLADVVASVDLEVIHGDAVRCAPSGDLTGWVFYLDPSCQQRGAHVRNDPGRRVRRLALSLAARNARVLVSERVPVPMPGWIPVQLDVDEWVTCSFEPVRRPPAQVLMDGSTVTPTRRVRRSLAPRPSAPVEAPSASVQLSLFQEGDHGT